MLIAANRRMTLPAERSLPSSECSQIRTNPLCICAHVATANARERPYVDPAASFDGPDTDDHIILEAHPEGLIGCFNPSIDGICRHQIPLHLVYDRKRPVERLLWGNVQHERLEIRIGFPL